MSDFSKYKVMELPRNVVVGHGVLPGIPENCTRLALPRSALLVADDITKKIAGLEIEALLSDAGYDVDIVCIKEADADTVTAIQNRAIEMKNAFLAGVGGGRPIERRDGARRGRERCLSQAGPVAQKGRLCS